MKSIHLAPYSPCPPNSGGVIRIESIWRGLAAAGEVQYALLGDCPAREFRKQLYEKGTWIFPAGRETPIQRQLRCMRASLTGKCIPAARYLSKKRVARLTSMIRDAGADVVIMGDTYMSELIPALRKLDVRIVIDTHNVESNVHRLVARNARSLGERLANYLLYRNTLAVEKRYFHLADQIWAISEEDAECYRKQFGLRNVYAIPSSLDLTRYARHHDEEPNSIVYTGYYSYWPNADAALRFIEISRQLKARGVEHKLYLVGRSPTPRMLEEAAGHEQIAITGEVPDIRPYIGKAAVFGVPLLAGSGVKTKMLEAMAMGKAIVTSPIGAQGLEITSGQHAEVVEIDKFADAIAELLSNAGHRQQLGSAAIEWMWKNRSQETVNRRVSELLQQLTGSTVC